MEIEFHAVVVETALASNKKVLLDRIWPFSCLLFRSIPSQGNTAEIVLNVLHRNFLGVDEFLGMVSMPLRDFDVYERPKTKWVQF